HFKVENNCFIFGSLSFSFYLSVSISFFPLFFFPVLGGDVSVICRECNLSLPFHGCLLDLGTCKTKPGQFCIKEIYTKLGIQWYSVKGCTRHHNQCFKRIVTTYEVHSTHCCHKPFCNF
ncbi:uncharacterized protein C9orf57 homolog, partial [Loxodonta africana]